jgi:hypothetical protein
MTNKRHTMAAVVLVLIFSGPVLAQSEPTWNRSVKAFAVLPADGGGEDVHVVWSMEVLDATDGIGGSLDTEVALLVNGTEVTFMTVLGSDPGSTSGGGDPSSCGLGSCSGSCGGVTVGGIATTLLCLDTNPPDCDCITPPLTSVFPGQALVSGDVITVLLRPAPGAIPDDNGSDDMMIQTFSGDPIFWNRQIVSVNLSPSATLGTVAGDVFFDIDATAGVRANYSGQLDLRTVAELRVNGSLVSTVDVPSLDLDLTWNPCNAACDIGCVVNATLPFLGTCQTDANPNFPIPCSCQYQPVPDILFPSISVQPDDVVVVILRPTPGTLPELPPFEEDDEGSVIVPNIPAVSQWGLIVMMVLVLTAGTVVYARRQRVPTP